MIHFLSVFLFSLFSLSLSATPSAKLSGGPNTPSLSVSPLPTGSDTSSSSAPTSTSFVDVTTTNAQGSTIVTSIPITVAPRSSMTLTSSAPFPSLTGYPACVTNCLTDAVAKVNCTSVTAVACYCPNVNFPIALYSCVASTCGADIPSAESLAQQFCALDNITLSFVSTAAISTPVPLASQTPTGSTTSPNSNTPNAALTLSWMSDTRGWTGMAFAACGAVFGAALI
ncbi:hypothetical protein F5148DRAFT_1235305 [Russula earlei]|uniref:Uncharacterized protein n=1 Tax=Russula earlei TaxID=71964 RepID=A0ACC0TXT8_9AGAM|nr:hypothetical protein F5148DRAFT_1235305 [Russula earlei]